MPRRTFRKLAPTLAAVSVVLGAPAVASAAPVTHALYHMNELPGATKMVDSSGYGNTATLTSFGITLGVPGFSGTAYRFTGNGGRATVASSSSLNPGSANISFVAHFASTTAPSATVGDYDVMRKGLSGTTGGYYKMEVWANGQAACYFGHASNAGGTYSVHSTTSVLNGAWHTITCSKTSSAITVNVDGKTWSKAAVIGSIANTATFTVGAKDNGEDTVTGSIDEVSVAIG